MMRALLMTLALMPLRTPAQNSGKPAMAPYVMDDSSIRTAVPKWLDNPTVAEAEYGHISTWETSGVTDMSFLFCASSIGWCVDDGVDMSHTFHFTPRASTRCGVTQGSCP